MRRDEETIRRLFPSYFELFDLPEGAREEKVQVYRACKTNECDNESFTPSYEEKGCIHLDGEDPKDPGLYSLSTYEKPKDVKRFAICNVDYKKPYKIAFGVTDESCGPAQRTRERVKRCRNSHVDWWLYESAKPYEYFDMIDDFEIYYEEYKKRNK